MDTGFIVRLRPIGPWRLGPSSGARNRVDRVLHSDTLYSALTIASRQLGMLSEWLGATAEAKEPAVRVGSAFPFTGRTLLAPAPRHVWPPASSSKIRWKAARFVPLQVVPRLLAYESLKEDRWAVDPISEAVLPVEKFGEVTPPFRIGYRRTAIVDRISGVSHEAAELACLEFSEGSGMWCPVLCSSEWTDRVKSLFRFIADAGVGGERSSGWGKSAVPEFEPLPSALTTSTREAEHHETGYWVLSLFAPSESDRVDWTRGSYALLRRSGRTDSDGALKIESAMVEEGSIVVAESAPTGFARDVAPGGSNHAVYRVGFAVSVPISFRLPTFQALQKVTAVEPSVEEAPPAEPTASDQSFEDSTAQPLVDTEPEIFTVETSSVNEGSLAPEEAEAIEDATAEPPIEPASGEPEEPEEQQ
ncbi:MAG TPA: type III-A CRISPR-associated RAMP protein Csm4 [Bryobacteraceae bacterium]|nr:type III-A CRISPR-associated RAMP protein Csm4 [Bryobacteraceae bacterium]